MVGGTLFLQRLRGVTLRKGSVEKKAGTHEVNPNLSPPFKAPRTLIGPGASYSQESKAVSGIFPTYLTSKLFLWKASDNTSDLQATLGEASVWHTILC